MGFLFTLLYIAAAYTAPQTIFGELAALHIQIVIVLLAVVFSISSLGGTRLFTMPQTYGLIGLSIMVALSIAFNGWVGGAPVVLLEFVPNAIVFFLVLVNCKTKLRVQIVVAVLFLVAISIMVQGWQAQEANNLLSPYVLSMKNDDGIFFNRLRGLSFLNDPNDLAQFMAGLIPCMFLAWKKSAVLRNFLLIYVPVALLLYGMFLTHSRGGMLGLLAMVMVLFRRKIGVVRSVITGGLVFLALTAVGWSGGRDLSADSGADRMDAWSTGLSLIRSHPFFGVGYLRFTDYFEITAHNTVVVCAAETGVLGLFFWIMLVYPSARNVAVGAKPLDAELPQDSDGMEPLHLSRPQDLAPKAAAPMLARSPASVLEAMRDAGPDPAVFVLDEDQGLSEEEGRRLCSIMLISLTGFLTPAWFLSRPYTMALFVEIGLAAAIYNLANQRSTLPPPMPFGRVMRVSAMVSVALILAVYVIVRIDRLIRL